MIEIGARELSWLQGFFAGENCLKWNDIANETAPLEWMSQVLPWLKFLQRTPLGQPLVLPVFGPNGPRLWYGVADNEQIAAQMTQEIQGFIGPSYSDFDGHLCELSPSDPIEAALGERFGPLCVFRRNVTADSE